MFSVICEKEKQKDEEKEKRKRKRKKNRKKKKHMLCWNSAPASLARSVWKPCVQKPCTNVRLSCTY